MTGPKPTASENLRKIAFIIVFLACFSSFTSPPLALTLGILFGLALSNPFPFDTRRISFWLLQGSVVALGFGINLYEVLKIGRSGFIYTALGIVFALVLGLTLGKILRVHGNSSYLITAGTAICGGSAIAAIGVPMLPELRDPYGIVVAARTADSGVGVPLETGDVIRTLNGEPMTTLERLREALAKLGRAVALHCRSSGTSS